MSYGIERLPEGKRRAELGEKAEFHVGRIPCEPIPEGVGDAYANITRARERQGYSLDDNDLWIGLQLDVASLGMISIVLVGGRRWGIGPAPAVVVSAATVDALFLIAWLRITPRWVRRATDNYADSLLESGDATEPKI